MVPITKLRGVGGGKKRNDLAKTTITALKYPNGNNTTNVGNMENSGVKRSQGGGKNHQVGGAIDISNNTMATGVSGTPTKKTP